MKLSDIKKELKKLESLKFKLPNGDLVPDHFHVTEIGVSHKIFIDCGGTVREENYVVFQLWSADDTEHRLAPEKLLKIIKLAENELAGIEEMKVEVEYQSETIGKYGLEFSEGFFSLKNRQTDCLAKDKCGIPVLPASSCCEGNDCC